MGVRCLSKKLLKHFSRQQKWTTDVTDALGVTGLQINVPENYFSYFSTKTNVVGSQKNCLDETVLLSTQNKLFEHLHTRALKLILLNYSLHAGNIFMLSMLSAIVCACIDIMRITQKAAGQGAD